MRIASKLVCCLDAHRPILRSISWSQDCLILRQFRHIHLQTPALTFDAQSKECQKSDWKRAHKAACVAPATKPSRKPKGDQGARAQARKVDRWFNAWAPAIAWCLPIAMDLANHEWGHQPWLSNSCLLIRFRREASSWRSSTLALATKATTDSYFMSGDPIHHLVCVKLTSEHFILFYTRRQKLQSSHVQTSSKSSQSSQNGWYSIHPS